MKANVLANKIKMDELNNIIKSEPYKKEKQNNIDYSKLGNTLQQELLDFEREEN